VSRMQARRFLTALVLSIAPALAAGGFIGPALAAGQSPPAGGALRFRLENANPSMRSSAPFSITCLLNSTLPDVLKGELALVFTDDGQVCSRVNCDSIVVPSGESSIRVVLPSMAARRNAAAFAVHAVFNSSKGTFDLGNHDLIVPLRGNRQFLIAAPNLGQEIVVRLVGRLRLDSFRPAEKDSRRVQLVTLPVDVDLQDLPTQAIGLYPFDLLLLAGETFSRLSARQLDAVADWTEQGGRVALIPTGVLTAAHKQFLERITSRDPDAPKFVTDQFGRLVADPQDSQPTLRASRCGFGRALILRKMPQFTPAGAFREIEEPAWIRAVCFLWNVRPEQTETIVKTGSWTPPPKDSQDPYHFDPDRFDPDREPLQPVEFANAKGLRQLLFPRAVRVMPFGVVASILTLFLLAVAPGDYFLHGMLRRRISWVAYPAICLLFTLGTVWIAGQYTGRVDHRTDLVIVDLGVDGKPRRTSRIEHVITAQTRPLSSDAHNAVFTMTDVQPAAPNASREEQDLRLMRYPTTAAKDRLIPPTELTYTGTLPSAFSVTRLSRQWTPSMHRVTRTGADVDIPSLAWSDLDALDLSSKQGKETLVEAVRSAVPGCDLLLQGPYQQLLSRAGDGSQGKKAEVSVLVPLAERADSGLFSIVSHIAPNGAGDLEDLANVDPTLPDECLLQIATRQDDALIVYRRMMRMKPRARTESRP
jgi:hypothetical protein